jgi:hypothetical protein
MNRARHIVAATTLVTATALTMPALASAEGEAGLREGPVQFWAEGNDQCQVTFNTLNKTNGTYYVDFVVDDENPTALAGQPGVWSSAGLVVNVTLDGTATSRTVGRRGLATNAQAPLFQAGVTGYVRDREPVGTTGTINLRDLALLPNAGADSHTVTYQVVLGPDSRDKGWNSTTKTFARFTTDVTGCNTATTATLTGPSTVEQGTEAIFGLTVAPPEATGSVQFAIDGTPAGDPVPVSGGAASLAHTFGAPGDYRVTAEFTGDPGFENSTSNEVVVQVTAPGGGNDNGSSGSADLGWGS